MPNKFFLAVILFFSLVLASCTTMADFDFSGIDLALQDGKLGLARDSIEKSKTRIYGKHDEILSLLDEGILLHFDGNYSESNEKLSAAERLIQEYRAKSIAQSIGSALINDTVRDYSGEDFEDIYTNIFMSLNYIALNENDEAMVEMRRFNNKMQSLGARYETLREQLKRQVQRQNAEAQDAIKLKSVTFHNSALAHYLSLILYRADGNLSEAEVDLRYIDSAFKMQPSIYNFTMPALQGEVQRMPSQSARINFIAFSGLAPVKEEKTMRISLPNFYYKLSLPEMKSRASQVTSVKVRAVAKESGAVYEGALSKIESIDNIARDTFNDHYGEIAMRTLLRTISKTVASTSLKAYGEKDKSGGGVIASIFGLFGQLATEVTERADVRVSRYFPGAAHTGSMILPPGVYDLQIDFCSAKGIALSSVRIEDFAAKSGNALNLAESCCYK